MHIEECEKQLGLSSDLFRRGCLVWFMKEIQERGMPLPGALLGGKRQRVFSDVKRSFPSEVNALLSKLVKRNVLIMSKAERQVQVEYKNKIYKYG